MCPHSTQQDNYCVGTAVTSQKSSPCNYSHYLYPGHATKRVSSSPASNAPRTCDCVEGIFRMATFLRCIVGSRSSFSKHESMYDRNFCRPSYSAN